MNAFTHTPANAHIPSPVDPAARIIKPTKETYERLQQAHEYFNKALFGGTLPNALITFQRRKGTFGYFAGGRFQNDAGHEAEAIEIGIADASDPTLKERLAALKADRDQAKAAKDRASAELRPETRITEEKISEFAALIRENVANGAIPFRRAYLRSVIDQVEVDDAEIRIHGRRDVLERLVIGGGATPAGVPSFVRKWRTRLDSNQWPSPSEGSARKARQRIAGWTPRSESNLRRLDRRLIRSASLRHLSKSLKKWCARKDSNL